MKYCVYWHFILGFIGDVRHEEKIYSGIKPVSNKLRLKLMGDHRAFFSVWMDRWMDGWMDGWEFQQLLCAAQN
jgi:hypothetical protein